ncbi:hypothetical protein U9M48_021779 [Paspalum notatum var. saurae]|uniref:Pectinesterase inhibitor domain-containing protein n=1 Tax=Paspalum notatum var. saurae TaxID=547442 RepID=A0AAQ3TKD1_PASNO
MSSAMAQHAALRLILALAIAPGLTVTTTPAINKTCATLDAAHYDHPYSYCAGVLSADPAAAAATDPRGVADAAINVSARKAESTLRVLTDLVDELGLCRKYYGSMVESLAGVLADFHAGRFDEAALAKARSASDVPERCDVILAMGNAKKDPFSQENVYNKRLSSLASDITALVASKKG